MMSMSKTEPGLYKYFKRNLPRLGGRAYKQCTFEWALVASAYTLDRRDLSINIVGLVLEERGARIPCRAGPRPRSAVTGRRGQEDHTTRPLSPPVAVNAAAGAACPLDLALFLADPVGHDRWTTWGARRI
ncbi:hypothetical protein BOTBODRAFT_217175 [Botryobasidium botryosum FD-172 SS1]|uniref:Uncharacterized protein n=1 Tax=Botryobasidium botryosum (strain FD-172 SS1) TaxID=930990 RepID=A0A067NDS3_BOTB1|nr:hypothetical protein BOTBODRAFT_217175 [Botryobasidium botryosum FD-172 SS1]